MAAGSLMVPTSVGQGDDAPEYQEQVVASQDPLTRAVNDKVYGRLFGADCSNRKHETDNLLLPGLPNSLCSFGLIPRLAVDAQGAVLLTINPATRCWARTSGQLF